MDPEAYMEGFRFSAGDSLAEVLAEETARHAGHADIVRESLDGASSISLLAAAEDWPANGFVQPWKRDR